jgi:uncharacterized membrane protein YdbT with pleckstrin-like domain
MSRDIHFPGREADEQTILVLHKHWLVFVRSVILFVLLGGAPAVVWLVWSRLTDWTLVSGTLSYTLIVSALGLYILFIWILIYDAWLSYYLDVFIVTNKRIVDIEQSGLFGRTVAEERLYRIQDVASTTEGVLATMFRYGNVYVQTAGKTERFIFESVPNPEGVTRTILGLTDKIADHAEEDHHDHHEEK